MPTKASVGKKEYESTKQNHAEELLFASGKHRLGNITVELDAWPCTGERGHNCHALFQRESANRIITVVVGGDHGGYAKNHGKEFNATGTITYNNLTITYT